MISFKLLELCWDAIRCIYLSTIKALLGLCVASFSLNYYSFVGTPSITFFCQLLGLRGDFVRYIFSQLLQFCWDPFPVMENTYKIALAQRVLPFPVKLLELSWDLVCQVFLSSYQSFVVTSCVTLSITLLDLCWDPVCCVFLSNYKSYVGTICVTFFLSNYQISVGSSCVTIFCKL